jgi:hypothetical protein
MRLTRKEEILSAAFAARIEIVEALREVALGGETTTARLRAAAKELDCASGLYGDAAMARTYQALAELSTCITFLAEWRQAVLTAGIEAQRFLTAAHERATAWCAEFGTEACFGTLAPVAQQIASVKSVSEVATAAASLAVVPLPVGLYSAEGSGRRGSRLPDDGGEASPKPVELSVAFIKFTIDGKPLAETHYLSPGEMHNLDIEVRVSRWPAGATALILEPVTIEHPDAYKMPVFSLPAPSGAGPHQLKQQGRAAITIPNHFNARPYEFKYLARFEPQGSEQPVETIGQRTLMLEGTDLARQPLTGYQHIDRKLIEIRDTLRVSPHMIQQELTDALTLAFPLANLAAQSVQDNVFPSPIGEDAFQKHVRSFLRSHPMIGAALEEHPHASRGITDLSFRGVRLELKSEQVNALALADCQRFAPQAASYAVGSGKRLALLCVLDGSPKLKPPFPVEDGFTVFIHQTTETPVYVLTILIQGNLAKPSDFSR